MLVASPAIGQPLASATTAAPDRMLELARAFPSLRDCPLVRWDAATFDDWATENVDDDAARHAARFVLSLWNDTWPWRVGRFDVTRAVRKWDDDLRNGALDATGIVDEDVFPNTVPPFFPSFVLFARPPRPEELRQRLAGIRAHNRWMAEWCARFPERRAGIAIGTTATASLKPSRNVSEKKDKV